MIVSDKYIKWFKETDKESRTTVFNHAIYIFASMGIVDRLSIALEILLGKKFCIWISRNQ